MAAPSGGSSVPPLNVRIVVSTSGAAAAATTMRSVTNAAGGMGGAVGKSAMNIRTLGDAMRQTGSLIKYSVIGGLVNMGTAAIQASRTFELSMKRIQGLVGLSGNQVQAYKDNILSLGAATAKGPIELAEALYFITSAGINGSLALDVLKESARSAAAGLGETQVVADALTSILNAYGEATYSAAKANDILVATVREGKAEADQFAPALGKVLPIAAAFGASFEDVSAGVAALTRGGASAGTSAIYLRQVLSQLLKPSKQAAETMLSVGTSAGDLRKRIQQDGLLTALEYLNTQLGGDEYNIAAEGMTKVFGNVRALTAVFSLLGPNLEANREIFYELNNAAGASAVAFEAYSQSADYAFKKAAAEGQAAMVRLGDAVMPAATSLIGLAGAMSRVSETLLRFGTGTGIIGKFGRAIFVAAAAGVILSKGLLFLFLRLSSYVRLMGNGITVLRGFAGSLRTANGQTITLSNSMRMLGFSTAQQTQIMAAAKAATGAQTVVNGQLMISEQALLGIMAAKAGPTKMGAQLTVMQANASKGAKIAFTEQAIAEYMASKATKTLGHSMKVAFPLFIGLATLAYTLASSFGLIGGGIEDNLEGDSRSLSDLNDLLGITAEYAKSSLTVNVGVDINGDAISPGEQNKKLIDALETSLGEDIASAMEAASTYGGENAKINLAAAIIGQLDLSTEEQAKMQKALGNYFTVDPQLIAAAAETAGSELNSKFIIAANTPTEVFGPDMQPDYDQLDKVAANAVAFIAENVKGSKIDEVFKNLGTNLSTSLNSLDFGTFIETIGGVEKQTAGMTNQSGMLLLAMQKAFSEDNIDATALGNQFEDVNLGIAGIFGNVKNADNLTKLLEPIGVSSEEAQPFIDKINKGITDLGKNATEAQKIRVVADSLNNISVSAKTTSDALAAANAMTYNIATEFKNGLNPEIQAVVDSYNEATEAIKRYEEGQKALAGSSQDLILATIDANEAASSFGESYSKAGNKVGTSGLAGDAMKDLIKFKDEILNVSNIITSTEGPAAGAKFFAAEWQVAMETLTKGGMSLPEAEQQLIDIGFALNEVPKTWTGNKDEILSGLSDAYKTSTALPGIGTDIASGISAGLVLGQSDKTAISSFNKQMVQLFKDDWGIKSPSKVSQEIGTQIKIGLINGLTDLSQGQLNALEWLGKKIAGTITAAMYADLPSMVDLGNAYGINAMSEKEGGVQGILNKKTGYTGIDYRLTDKGAKTKINIPDIIDPLNPAGSKDKKGGSGSKDDTVYLAGAMGETQKRLKKWLEGISKIAQFTTEYIQKVSGDAGKSLNYITSFIDAQLNKSDAILSRQKLLIAQELLIADIQKAQRNQMYAAMKQGANLGRDVTGYEMSRIQDLQTAYETAVRNYSMKRGSYADMIDAQIALQEAQASASETSSEAVSAETSLMDAKQKLIDKDLELAKSTMSIVEAQQEQVDSAINLQIHMDDARNAFNQFAYEAIPGVITSLDGLGLGLSDPKGVFMTSLHGLGNNIFNLLATAAKEAGLISGTGEMGPPPPEFFPGAGGSAGGSAGGAASLTPAPGAGDKTSPNFGKRSDGKFYVNFMAAVRAIHPGFDKLTGATPVADSKTAFPNLYNLYKSKGLALAKGGLVMGATQALIGEAGPELVLPLNNMNITTALERLTNVKQQKLDRESDGNSRNQVFNIIVNNPVPETASESISRRMKTLSNAGLFG